MAEITITVDGVQITVPDTMNVVDAARLAATQIPVFCYHPRLPAVGMCRMCMVAIGMPRIDRDTRQPMLDEHGKPIIQMFPKLQPACTTRVADGMVVITNSEEVKFAQNGVLEFLLTSHPLDCPVCDKGGECPLQNLTMEWGPGNSRFDYSDKVHFEKPYKLGDLINLDRERCILCSRCVRFQDDLADDPVLGFDQRGRKWHIISKSDPPFDSKFSGNTTDICPVGALTTSDFRFRARAWELTPVPSLCNHCAVGCNITLDMRHNQLKRVMPRDNAAVNDIWICDKGRFGHRFIESDNRLTTPLVRRDGQLQPATWDEALDVIATNFRTIQDESGGAALGGLAGEHLANEDLFLFQRLFREVLGSNNLDTRTGAPGEYGLDDVGYQYGVGVGTNLMDLGKGTAVLVFGADPEEEAPLYMLRLRQIATRGGSLIVANPRPTKLDRSATQTLRYRPDSERELLLALLKLVSAETKQIPQRTTGGAELKGTLEQTKLDAVAKLSGIAQADLERAAQTILAADNLLIVYGADVLVHGASLSALLANLLILRGKVGLANSGLIPLLARGNSRGALDMGVRPDKAAGYVSLKQPGLTAREMWSAALAGKLRGMYLMGSDPVASYDPARAALDALAFLVVQDTTLTATAQLADVVLPGTTVAEYDATYTNAERRVQRARLARKVHDASKPNWEIVQAVAQALQAEPVLAGAASSTTTVTRTVGGNGTSGNGVQGKLTLTTSTASSGAAQASWDYMTAAEVAADIADLVPGYAGITHTTLAQTAQTKGWGRQANEDYFYDGTSYTNAEGVGLQVPSGAELPKATFDMTPPPATKVPVSSTYPFALLVQTLAYRNDPFLHDSLLQSHIPAGYIALNTEDAAKLGIAAGAQVQITSATGSLRGTARVVPDLPVGCVLVPAGLADLPVSTIQTGALTRVAVSSVAE